VLNPRKSSINIACAIPKKSKFDDIVDKLTQLGVDRIIPLKTERAVVKLSIQKGEARLQRWVKIALSAAQQSQRSILPQISPLTDFRELIKKSTGFNLKLIPTLEGERKTLKEALSPVLPLPANILILIGPEGDFSPKEIDLALKHNFIPVSLGSTVLRVETAAIAVASFINLNEDR
jgi:16S rRNA (uracil1498-N3)-methyltransferase